MRGFALVDILIAVVIILGGLTALTRVVGLYQDPYNKEFSEAQRVAQGIIDTTNPTTPPGVYTREHPKYMISYVVGTKGQLEVTVTWQDRNGVTQKTVFTSVMTRTGYRVAGVNGSSVSSSGGSGSSSGDNK